MKPMSELEIAPVMIQGLCGLDFRNLNREVKLGDVGLALSLEGHSKESTFVGTPWWMGSELIAEAGRGDDEKGESWSCGIATIEMAGRVAPYSGMPGNRVILLIPHSPSPTLEGDYATLFGITSQKIRH
jgi:serine/threonine protein kinase